MRYSVSSYSTLSPKIYCQQFHPLFGHSSLMTVLWLSNPLISLSYKKHPTSCSTEQCRIDSLFRLPNRSVGIFVAFTPTSISHPFFWIRGLTQKFPDNVLFAVCSNTVAGTTSGARCYMLLVYLCKISGVYVKFSILYARVNEVCKVSHAVFQKNGNKHNYWTTDCYEIFNKIRKNERRK